MKQNENFSRIEDFFPATFHAADKLAIESQNFYLLIVGSDLMVLVLSAAFGLLPRDSESWTHVFRISAFCLIFLGTILFILLILLNLDKVWYGGRAVAETIKSVTWQFLMDTGPFSSLKTISAKENRLLKDIEEVREREAGLKSKILSKFETEKLEINETLREFKKMEFGKKKDFYLSIRLKGQKSWYFKKARFNKKHKWFWYISVLLIHVGALISAYFGQIDLTAFLVAFAGVSFSWLQLKRHQELEESYSIAGGDLGITENKFVRARKQTEISVLVMEAEKAISREHSIWVFRGGITPAKLK